VWNVYEATISGSSRYFFQILEQYIRLASAIRSCRCFSLQSKKITQVCITSYKIHVNSQRQSIVSGCVQQLCIDCHDGTDSVDETLRGLDHHISFRQIYSSYFVFDICLIPYLNLCSFCYICCSLKIEFLWCMY
jgi:hypothetical protein